MASGKMLFINSWLSPKTEHLSHVHYVQFMVEWSYQDVHARRLPAAVLAVL